MFEWFSGASGREWATSSLLRLADRRGGAGRKGICVLEPGAAEGEVHMLHTSLLHTYFYLGQ